MKVLVTGAAGFIGSHVVERLIKRGDEVGSVDNLCDYYDPKFKYCNVKANDCWITDVRDFAAFSDHIMRDMSGCDCIVHLAAHPGVRASITRCSEYIDNNLVGTQNVLECAVRLNVKHIVFASTSSVYGHSVSPFREDMPCDRPLAPYPASKRMAEIMAHAFYVNHGLNFTALRFFSVYGPRARPDMMPYMTVDAIAKGNPITLYNRGQMCRDWTHVDDIVSGIVAAVDRPMGYEIINLGKGDPVRMDRFISRIEDEMGKQVDVIHKNAPSSEPMFTCADISKARDLLGYDPTITIEQGIPTLCDWYKNTQVDSMA